MGPVSSQSLRPGAVLNSASLKMAYQHGEPGPLGAWPYGTKQHQEVLTEADFTPREILLAVRRYRECAGHQVRH